MMKRIAHFLTLSALSAGLFGACGKADVETLSVNLVADPSTSGDVFGLSSADNPQQVRVRAFQGFEQISETESFYQAGTLTMPTVGYGTDNWISVEASSGDAVLSSGATTTRFDYERGDTLPGTLNILLTRVNAFSEAFGYPAFDANAGAAPQGFAAAAGRTGHTLSELPGGHVVAIGGVSMSIQDGAPVLAGDTLVDTIEGYDAYEGSWATYWDADCTLNTSECELTFPKGLAFHTATVISDNEILIIGGISSQVLGTDSVIEAESRLYVLTIEDPVLRTARLENLSSAVAVGASAKRAFHTADLMQNGDVLIVGGIDGSYGSPTYEGSVLAFNIFDNTLTNTNVTVTPRALHESVNVSNDAHGLVVTGGRNADSVITESQAIYYDQGAWQVTSVAAGQERVQASFGAGGSYLRCADTAGVFYLVAGGYTAVDGLEPLRGANPSSAIDVYAYEQTTFNNNLSAGNWDGLYGFTREADLTLQTARALPATVAFSSGDFTVAGGVGADGTPVTDGETYVNRVPVDVNLPYACGLFIQDNANAQPTKVYANLPQGMIMAESLLLPNHLAFFTGGSNGSGSNRQAYTYNNNDFAWLSYF